MQLPQTTENVSLLGVISGSGRTMYGGNCFFFPEACSPFVLSYHLYLPSTTRFTASSPPQNSHKIRNCYAMCIGKTRLRTETHLVTRKETWQGKSKHGGQKGTYRGLCYHHFSVVALTKHATYFQVLQRGFGPVSTRTARAELVQPFIE